MKNAPPLWRAVPLLALALPFLALAGCAHKDTLVGKWQGTVTQPGGSIYATFDFTPDGRETIHSAINQGARTRTIDVRGTYRVNGTNLTQNLTAMTMDFQTMPIPPNQAQTAPFMLEGDHLTLTNPGTGESLTLTRVKE